MGLYNYTLRSDTKVVEGLKIGRYGYAYKESFWRDRKVENRFTAQAERALEKNGDLEYVIVGDWELAEGKYGKLPVIEISRPVSQFLEELPSYCSPKIVGYLVKEKGRYKLEGLNS